MTSLTHPGKGWAQGLTVVMLNSFPCKGKTKEREAILCKLQMGVSGTVSAVR